VKFRSDPIDVGAFTVTFTFDGKSMGCEWEPDVPSGKSLEQVLSAYTAARNKFLTEVAKKTNTSIGVVEL